MNMMRQSPAIKNPAGKLSVLERALSKKQKPMKKPMPRPKAQSDFVKGAIVG